MPCLSTQIELNQCQCNFVNVLLEIRVSFVSKTSRFYENASEYPVLWTGMNEANIKFDRRDILVPQRIFAEARKP